eukprot:2585122-Heterocapsa_arctica.AAC.1
MAQEQSMEASRALVSREKGNKTSASSSESPGKVFSGGSAAGRKRAGEHGSAREARNPEPLWGPGPPVQLEASRGDDLGGRGGSP